MTQHNKKHLIKKGMAVGALTAAIGAAGKLTGKPLSHSVGLGLALALGASTFISAPAYAISESSVQAYAAAMNQAANSQNIGQISRLIADDAIIKMTRNGNSADLSKTAYLQYLQKSWAKSKNYRYDIRISDVVLVGGQARAQVVTTETWTEDGNPVRLVTTSKVTLTESGASTVLLRSSAQVVIN